jgi:hypothetical protein
MRRIVQFLVMAGMLIGATALPEVTEATEPSYQATVYYNVATGDCFHRLFDMNGDGLVDIVVVDRYGKRVGVLLGNGAGGFVSAGMQNTDGQPTSLTVTDFNRDGRPDVALSLEKVDLTQVFLGDGGGGLSALPSFSSEPAIGSVEHGDFDEDGIEDLVIADGTAGATKMVVYAGVGDGTFVRGDDYTVGDRISVENFFVYDSNQDGHLDVALVLTNGRLLRVLTGDGSGHFSVGPAFSPWGLYALNDIIPGDINGDGRVDFISANNNSHGYAVFLANASTPVEFSMTARVVSGWISPWSGVISDVDLDGYPDFVICDYGSNRVSLLRGDGSGSFTAWPTTYNIPGAMCAKASDINGDSVPDIIVSTKASGKIAILLSGPPVVEPPSPPTTCDRLDDLEDPGVFASTWTTPDRPVDVVEGGFGTGSYWAHGYATGENDAVMINKTPEAVDGCNYTIQADIRWTSNDAYSHGYLYFLVQDADDWIVPGRPRNGYRVDFAAQPDIIRVTRYLNGNAVIVAETSHPVTAGTQYRVGVRIQNADFDVLLDGTAVLHGHDDTFETGTFGVGAGTGGGGWTHVDGYFDNFCTTFGEPCGAPISVAGTVTSSCGEAVPGATLTLLLDPGDPEQTTLTTETDATGHYSLADVPPSSTPARLSLLVPPGYAVTTPGESTVDVDLSADITVDFAVDCLTVSVSGTVTAECSAGDCGGEILLPGSILVTLVDGAGNTVTATSGPDGVYRLDGVRWSSSPGSVTIEIPEGYEVTGGEVPAAVDLTSDSSVDFGLRCLRVSLSGAVIGCDGPLPGVTVDFLDGRGGFCTMFTDGSGDYSFDGIPYSSIQGSAEVSIVVPLGFEASNPGVAGVPVSLDDDKIQDFQLACLSADGYARSMGYWKHQCNVYLKGKGSAQETQYDITIGYPRVIFDHFYQNQLNSIQVPGVTFLEDGGRVPVTLQVMQGTFTVNSAGSLQDRAKQQYLALLLNVASGKVLTSSIVSGDTVTASQVLQQVADMINDGDPSNDESAKSICDYINNAQPVPGELIDSSYEFIPYGRKPEIAPVTSLHLGSSPIHGLTTIEVSFAGSGPVRLAVYDVAGREVSRILDEWKQAGEYSVRWDGASASGAPLPSGMYFIRLQTTGQRIVRKAVIIR